MIRELVFSLLAVSVLAGDSNFLKGTLEYSNTNISSKTSPLLKNNNESLSLALTGKYLINDDLQLVTRIKASSNTNLIADKSLSPTGEYERQDKDYLAVEALYLKYKMSDNFHLTVGTIPLFGDRYNNAEYLDIQGDGIKSTVGIILDTVAVSYTQDKNKYTLGYGCFMCLNKKVGAYQKPESEKSEGIWLISSHEYGKWSFDTNIFYLDFYLKPDYYSHLETYGLGASWDDTEYTGNLLYTTLALSDYTEDGIYSQTPARSEIGYAFLAGWSKESDILSDYIYKYKYGFEYYHSSEYWTNITTDIKFNRFDDDFRGDFGSIYTSFFFTKDLSMSLRYTKMYIKHLRVQNYNHLNPIKVNIPVDTLYLSLKYSF